MKLLLVGGTWSFRNDGKKMWHHYGSDFADAMGFAGHEILFGYNYKGEKVLPFEWESEVGGIGGSHGLIGWTAAGKNIYDRVVPPLCYDSRVKPNELLIIDHSHGMQAGLNAFAQGLKGSMISICGPVRKDMKSTVEAAKPNILTWVSLHSDESDFIQVAGSHFDFDFPFSRAWRESDNIIRVPRVGHTGLIDEKINFRYVLDAIGLVEFRNSNISNP